MIHHRPETHASPYGKGACLQYNGLRDSYHIRPPGRNSGKCGIRVDPDPAVPWPPRGGRGGPGSETRSPCSMPSSPKPASPGPPPRPAPKGWSTLPPDAPVQVPPPPPLPPPAAAAAAVAAVGSKGTRLRNVTSVSIRWIRFATRPCSAAHGAT